MSLLLSGVLLAGTALAQPAVAPGAMRAPGAMIGNRPAIAALAPAQRAMRIRATLQPFDGKPLSGPFVVGPGLPTPAAVVDTELYMVRGAILGGPGNSLAEFLTTSTKTAVDVVRPMVVVALKPHAKPYLVDCSLAVGGADQHVAYFDAATPTYHSKIIEQKSLAAVMDGHALFAVAAATAVRYLYVGPIFLSQKDGWSMSLNSCEFSMVG